VQEEILLQRINDECINYNDYFYVTCNVVVCIGDYDWVQPHKR